MKTIPLNSAHTTPRKKDVHGILLLDKAQGLTSNRALQKIKRLFAARKAGHCGTLDPLATGVLPICLGEATKFSQYLLDADKTYEVTALLGVTTTTGDSEGEVLTRSQLASTVLSQLPVVLQQMTGRLEQTPPMYSALKHQGRALYDYVRAGITIERAPRQITIYQIDVLEGSLPFLYLRVRCSKGTYIRVLIEDIGRALGCGAHVVTLRRAQINGLPCDKVLTEIQLEALAESDRLAQLLPADFALQRLPRVLLDERQSQQLLQGIKLPYPTTVPATEVAVYQEHGGLLGVATCRDQLLVAKRLLSNTMTLPGNTQAPE